MKHILPVSLILIFLFLFSQIIGLALINIDAKVEVSEEGEIKVVHDATAFGERPDMEGGETTAYILAAVFFGTLLLLLLIKFGKIRIWKAWYFLAVWATVTISIGVFLHPLIAGAIALGLSVLKVFRPHIITHNATELFMYSGIALLFVPLIDVTWMIVILLLISAYDMYAVWKSRHMISMAKFTMESKVFAGLAVPYKGKSVITRPVTESEKGRTAILGGGDIAFPLMFGGAVMEELMLGGATKAAAYYNTLVIAAFATIAIAYLMIKGEKGKFYPAMPYLTAACLLGYFLVSLF